MILDDIYGTDLSCVNDFEPTLRMVTAEELLAQAVVRRLTTPRGGLIDDPDYGFDIRGLLNRGLTQALQASLPGLLRQEILKDERIDSADVVFKLLDPTHMTFDVSCTAGAGPFTFTVSVSEAGVLLLAVGGGQ